MRSRNNNFSKIEFFVCILVLTLMAAVVLPNYKVMAKKSKSTEAKTNLSYFYTAQKAFHSEWKHYDGGFLQIGFYPKGELSYDIVSSSLYKDTEERLKYITENPEKHFQTRYLSTAHYCSGSEERIDCYMGKTAVRPSRCKPNSQSNNTFVACAGAYFEKENNDEWSINQDKKIVHVSSGE